MSAAKIDLTKEEINYLKLWIGIAVVTDLSLFSWLVTNAARAGIFMTVIALAAAAGTTSFVFTSHKRIVKQIKELEGS